MWIIIILAFLLGFILPSGPFFQLFFKRKTSNKKLLIRLFKAELDKVTDINLIDDVTFLVKNKQNSDKVKFKLIRNRHYGNYYDYYIDVDGCRIGISGWRYNNLKKLCKYQIEKIQRNDAMEKIGVEKEEIAAMFHNNLEEFKLGEKLLFNETLKKS